MSENNTKALDPFTGLPISEKPTKENTFTNPFTGKQEVGTYQGPLPTKQIGVGANYTDPVDRYQKYNVPLRRQFDWNEERAQRQPTSEKWANGLMKAGTTMVGAVADGTIGVVAGIFNAANQGSWSGLYDNPVGRAVDKMNDSMRDLYPNYYTEAEQEAQGLAALGYANFWADKAANGFGYALASIATVIGTGGIGLVGRGMGLATKGLRMYKAANLISKGAGKFEAARGAINATAALGKATKLAQVSEVGAMMAYGESAVEAREVLNHSTQVLMEQRAAELGISPDQLSGAEMQEIRNTAASAANVAFALNMSVLSATNLITFNKILFPKYFNVRPKMKGMSYNQKVGKIVDHFKDDPLWKTTLQRYASVPAYGALTETFQEGTQYAIQDAATNMAVNNYNDVQASWTEALAEGYGETFNTKEGQESMMLGFIVGGLMGGGQSLISRFNKGSEDAQRAKVLAALNNDNILGAIDRANATEEQMRLANEMDVHLQNGDHKGYRDAQFKMIMSQVAMYDKAGALDLFEAMLDDAKGMSTEDFRQRIGAPEGVEINKEKIVEGIKKKIKEYEEHRNRVDAAMPTMPKMGIDRLLMSKEQKEAEKARLRDEEQLKEMMVKKAMGLEDADSRIDQLVSEINTARAQVSDKTDQEEGGLTREEFRVKGTEAPVTLTEIGPLTLVEENEQLTKETTDKLDKIVKEIKEVNPALGAEVEEKARDLKRLANDRGVFVNATRELFGSPEQRTAYFQREKQAERRRDQEAAVVRAKEELSKSSTSKELLSLIEQLDIETLTPEFAQELLDEQTRREDAEDKLREEHRRMSTDELQQELERELAKEEPNKVAVEILRESIKEREERGQKEGDVSKDEPTESEIKTQEQAQVDAEQAEADAEVEAAKEQQSQERESQGKTDVTSEEIQPFTVVTANGEFEFKDGRVIFSNGQPNEGYLAASKGINRAATRQEGLEGSPVVFRFIPNDEYGSIGIYLNGETLIGVVAATKGGSPREEFNRLKSLLESKGEMAGTVKRRFMVGRGNILTEKAETPVGPSPLMKPVSAAMPEKPAGFVGYAVKTRTGLKYAFDKEQQPDEVKGRLGELETRLQREGTGNRGMTPGQVGMVIAVPNGDLTILPMSSTTLGGPGVQMVLDMLAQNDITTLDRIRDIAGIRRTFGEPVKFTIDIVNGKYLINLKMSEDTVISIGSEELLKFMNGGSGKFRIGNFEETTNKEGEKEVKFVASKENPSQADYDTIAGRISQQFRIALEYTKKQFDIELVDSEGAFVSPYTGKPYPEGYMEYVEAEVLQTDVRLTEDGSPFFDVQVSIEVQGVSAEESVETTSVPTDDRAKVTVEVEEKATDGEPGTRHNEDDLFGEEEEPPFVPGKLDDGSVEIKHNNNTYIVKYDGQDASIINKKSGKKILVTSSVGKAVVDKWVALQEESDEFRIDPETGQAYNDEDITFRLGRRASKKINREKAIRYLTERFGKDAVVIFDKLQMVGDNVVHGYMENAAVYLWKNAEVGTEYHEAFHLFFRTLQSDKQRTALYNDAVKIYGEPTAEQIAAARRGQSELSNQEARLLALEERMAEEFREYNLTEEAPKSLGQRIIKFFADLLAYVKALSVDSLTVRQAFRLIESNRIPAQFSRTAAKFSPGKAFMMKEYALNQKLHREMQDLILLRGLEALEGSESSVEAIMGTNSNPELGSPVRDWFLRYSVHKPDGTALKPGEFLKFQRAYESSTQEARQFILDNNLKSGAPEMDSNGVAFPRQMVRAATNGKRFRVIYDNWYDQKGELGGVAMRGFLSEVSERLKREFGYKLQDTEALDADAEFERIYERSRLEEDPAKKMSAKAKRVLSRIPINKTSNTYFGFRTYLPADDVFRELSGIVHDSPNLQTFLQKLRDQQNSISTLRAVYNKINSMNAQEQALVYSTLSMSMADFVTVTMETTADLESGESTIKVKIFSPNSGSIDKYFGEKWSLGAISEGGVYFLEVNEDGDVLSTQVAQARAKRIQKLADEIENSIESPTKETYVALADMLWDMGIELAADKKEARRRLEVAFTEYGLNMRDFLKSDTRLLEIARNKFAPGLDNYGNIFTTETSSIRAVSKIIMSKFEGPKAQSFLNASGNMTYPINLKSDFDITASLVQSGEYARMMANTAGHQAGRVKSLALLLAENQRFRELFSPKDFDGLRSILSETNADLSVYKSMTYEDALKLSLTLFANPNAKGKQNEMAYIAIDTQADRSRLTYLPIPKWWMSEKIRRKYGLQSLGTNPTREIVKNSVLIDLHRMHITARSKMSGSEELMTYHSKERWKEFQLLEDYTNYPNYTPQAVEQAAKDVYKHLEHGEPLTTTTAEIIDSIVEDVLDGEIAAGYEEIVEALGGDERAAQWVQQNVPTGSYIKGQELAFLESFAETDALGRYMSREILRSGINYVKDGADYNKRSGHSSVPGNVPMLQGESTDTSNQEYGMLREINEVTVSDLEVSLPSPQLTRLQNALARTVGQERAQKIVYGKDGRSGYTKINGTDAQGLISPTFYRHIQMGYGLWDMEVHEPVYRAWKDEGKPWDGEVVPLPGMKTSYEFRMKHELKMGDKTHNILLPVAHKNSYVVLTEELAEGNPILTNLLNRMELRGPYADPNTLLSQLELEPIHIVNTESAKKLSGYAPVDVRDLEGMSAVRVHKIDGRGFKIPQFIPDKKAQIMTFGRQPRKNMIANINPNTMYLIPGMDKPISGADLLTIYQNAVVAKLRLNENKVLKRLGYDKVLAAKTVKEKIDAMEALLPKLRDLLHELGVEKDYPQNLLDALELRKNEDGNLVTKIPLAFPSVQSKLEQLLFGLFRKEVYQQKMAGMEMIQFAEFGGTEKDGSLKFYDVVNGVVQPAEVDIRVDVLERMGIDPEQSLDEVNEQLKRMLGYRIPQQGKSSMLYFRVRKVLPKSHKKAIRVPAAITVQMGSDFDIDKLFVIFPEVEKNKDGQVVRSETDWRTLTSEQAFEFLSEKQLNNIIFDTFAAISSNTEHLHETIAPLDISDLEEAREAIGEEKPKIYLTSASQRLQTGVDNMLSGILRGLYANGIAGRNVATTALVDFVDAPITVDGVSLGAIIQESPFTGVPTDQYLSQYLSAAVDSVKDPIQSQINDNAVTAPLTIYMMSIGMTPRQAIMFLNLPGVKEKTDLALNTGQRLTKILGNIEPIAHPLSSEDMLANIVEEDEISGLTKAQYNQVLAFMAIQAQTLDNLYRVLTPDAIDKAGTVAQNQARIDRGESLEGDTYGGLSSLLEVTQGNAYPIVREYYRVIRGALELGGNIGFLSDQLAVKQFKNSLKAMTGRRSLNEAMHRDINRAILHHLVTRKGSPIQESGILDEEKVRDFHVLGGAAKLFEIVREHYEGTFNIVADSLQLRTEQFGEDLDFTYLEVDTNKLTRQDLKDQWTYTLQAMERDDALHEKLKEAGIENSIGETFLMNSVTTSGFAPAPTAYFSLFPTDLLVNGTRNTNLDVSAHLENEMKRLDQDNYLNDFLPSFITNYGTHKFGGSFLFSDPINSVGESFEAGERTSQYVVGQYRKKVVLYQRKGDQYVRIPTLGKQYTFYEHNVLDKDGNQVHSLIGDTKTNKTDATSTASQSRLANSSTVTVESAREQVQKLRAAFAKAGVNIRVIEGKLPQGVKGEVIGNVITLDMSQIQGDTVYHEFGHILVDMLPEDQRKRFIDQVKKARPDLANAVAAKYPELNQEDLGKEILVTAIGIEGARIERRQPNLIQRIINRVMRALGKLFGITPDAAAVIAEEMFAGQIRKEGLSLKFNPALQRSKTLDNQIDTVYKDVRDSLYRQLKRLRSYPESEQTDKRKLEIKTLLKNLDKIKRTKQDLDAFFDFQQYVVARVVEMQDIMATIKSRANRPLNREEKLETLRMNMEMKQMLDSLYDARESQSNIVKLTRLLRRMDFGEAKSDQARMVLYDLQDSIYSLSELHQEYNDVMLPLVSDTLATYIVEGTNDEVEQLIEKTIANKDISGWQVYSTFNRRPEFIAIIQKYKAEFDPVFGKLMLSSEFRSPEVQERFRDEMLEAKVNWLKSKRPGRDQILQELRDAQADKGYFSLYMDPAVYDSEANIQLFAAALKDSINTAFENTRKHIYGLQPVYDAVKNLVGSDFNEAKFNDQFLTTVRIPVGDRYEEVLALVQEHNVDEFYKNMESAMRALDKEFKKPIKTASKIEMKKWRYSPDGLKHRRGVIKWYKENTTPVEGAKEKIEGMNARINEVQAQLNAIDKDKNRDQFNLLLNQLQDLKDKKYANVTKYGQFIGDLVKPNEKYKSTQWERIQNNPILAKYYEYNKNAFFEAQKKVGRSQLFVNRWDKFSYVMPSVRQDGLGLLQQEGWKGFATEQIEDWKKLETDTEFGMWTQEDGDPVKSIPRFYTNPVNHKKVSRDIASSITQFVHMANNFEEKSKVAGLVESMLALHEQRGVLQLDETGRPIVDNLAKMSRQAVEFVTKPGATSNRYQFLQEFIDVNFYGQLNLKDSIRLPGGVSLQKAASKAASITALANLSFNMLQTGNQFILDNLMGTEEAFAGQFFTKSDMAWALKTYTAEGAAMGDLGKFAPRTKLGQAFQAFDAMNEVTNEIGQKLSSSATKKLIQTNPLMAPQYAIEHQTVGVRMLALMKNTMVKDAKGNPILNEDGSEANLWDMFTQDENGMYRIDPRVANVKKNEFIAKLHGVNRRANQIKGTFDRGMAERRAIGKLSLLFRKYFVPGLRKRFGHGSPFQVDYELGSVTRGMYFSFLDYLGQIPNRGVFGAYQSMSNTDQQNLKRTAYEMAALATTMTIFNVLMGMIDMDDEDEDSYWTVFAAYQARRLQTELLQFIMPGEFVHMAKAPMATTNYVDKYLTVMNQLFVNYPAYYMGLADEDAIYYQRKTGTAAKGDPKIVNQVKKVIPVMNGWQSSWFADGSVDVVKQKLRWFTQ